jgi:transposase
MVKERRKYDREFKKEIVRLVEEGNRPVKELAEDLEIHPHLIYKWRRKFLDEGNHAFPGKGHMKPEEAELRKIKKELADVKEERDILKKALAIFSKQPR